MSQVNNAVDDAKSLKFDVVSIRLSSASPKEQHLYITPDGYEAIGFPIETTLLVAYADAPFFKHLEELKGVPSWGGSERYDIRAKLAAADVAAWHNLNQNIFRTAPVLQHMLQQVLAERCNLRIHGVETKVDGLALHIGAKSPALVEDSTVPAGGAGSQLLDGARFVYTKQNDDQTWTFYNTSMSVLANWLTVSSKYQVEDRTGLQGRYRFVLRRLAEQPAEGDSTTQVDAPMPWDLHAVGLKVDREKMPSKIWIIDSIERPSSN
ncbi:TIGR03435 family protein [Terriglobus roseus]|uniref:TIGR03435 family protein n=1 Tax=Terriglobus roseus TaxID=392734 RepID=UPI001E51FCD7|nr:TIGR03435 family protein [Terriglobus roseus]